MFVFCVAQMKLEPPVPTFKRVAASTSALTPRHAINSSNSSTQFKQPIVSTNMAKPQCKKKTNISAILMKFDISNFGKSYQKYLS